MKWNIVKPLVVLGLLLYLLWPVTAQDRIPYAIDEEYWVGTGYVATLLFDEGASSPLWADLVSYPDPILPSVVFGLTNAREYYSLKREKSYENMVPYLQDNGVYIQTSQIPRDVDGYYRSLDNYQNVVEWNPYEAMGRRVEELVEMYGEEYLSVWRVIKRARMINTVVFAMSGTLVYLIGRVVFRNEISSIIMTLVYGTSRMLVTWSLRALSESLLLFFVMLGLYVLVKFHDSKSYRKRGYWAVLGLVCSLAVSSKFSGGVLLVTALCVILLGGALKRSGWLANCTWLVVFFVGGYFGLNPMLWKGGLTGPYIQYQQTVRLKDWQTEMFPQYALLTYWDRLVAAIGYVMNVGLNGVTGQIGVGIFGLLMVSGLWRSAYLVWRGIVRNEISSGNVVAIYCFVTFVAITATNPMDWERYFVLLVFPACYWVVSSVDGLIGYVKGKWLE